MRKKRETGVSSLTRHRQEHARNLAQMEKLKARNEALEKIITEEENTEVIALVRSYAVSVEELAEMVKRLRSGMPVELDDRRGKEDEAHESDA